MVNTAVEFKALSEPFGSRLCTWTLAESIIKTPISESRLLSSVRKSITLQQNANLLIANRRLVALQLQRNHGEMDGTLFPLEPLGAARLLLQHWLHHLWDMLKNENGVSLVQK